MLPTAIDKQIQFKFKKNGTPTTCNVYSKHFDTSFTFHLNAVQPSKQQWENYILGVIFEIQQLTDKLQGFDCMFTSDIPVGSGTVSYTHLTLPTMLAQCRCRWSG